MAQAKTNYDMTVYPMTMAVRSASDGARVHLVQLPYCDCPDFTNRRGQLTYDGNAESVTICKHIREAMARVGGWHRTVEPEVHERLMLKAASEVLSGTGLNPGAVRLLMDDAADNGKSEFYPGIAGAKVGGIVTADKLRSRWSITLYI